MKRLALLSTSDKTGLIELGRCLVNDFDFDIISSGGTAQALKAAGVPVTKVSDYTGSPEILAGRVKTLHPKIHGGILARQDLADDLADLEANGIRPIALVVVNLYPFQQTIAQPNVALVDAVEQIDIGGPAMLRAAAKNFAHLTVLCNPAEYDRYLQEMRDAHGNPSLSFRLACAQKAFEHTATYDSAIATYLARMTVGRESMTVEGAQITAPTSSFIHPSSFTLSGSLLQPLRYGENPHQPAAWYRTKPAMGWAIAEKIQGKELSYNNLVDLEAARRIVAEFEDAPAAVIIKHTNPCGVAIAPTIAEAYTNALAADSVSAFGGIVALNRPIDSPTATALTQIFLECIVAPGCDPQAQAILAAKSKVRVLLLPDLHSGAPQTVKVIAGGVLVQAADDEAIDPSQWRVVTDNQPTPDQMAELTFAWKVCKHVKSNAIVVTHHHATLGIGAGQMNRVGSVALALQQAGDRAVGAVLASDGFFPFDDSVRTAAAAGIRAIVQPGGSLRDQDSIDAANELGLTMIVAGTRHFSH